MNSKGISYHWFIRLGLILLIFLCIFVFAKLSPILLPILKTFFSILLPFIISGFIAYLLYPLVEKLHDQGIPRGFAIFTIYLLFFSGLGFTIYKTIPLIINQLKELNENIPYVVKIYRNLIDEIYIRTEKFPDGVQTRIDTFFADVEKYLDNIVTKILAFLRGMFSYIVLLALIPIISFYYLKDIDIVKKAAWYMTPRKFRKSGRRLLKDIDETLGGYIRGQLLVCLLVGLTAMCGFWIANIPYPLLLGIIVGITDIIPYFGPVLGAIPAIIVAFSISLNKVFIVIGIIILLQFLEGNLLSPLIVGKSLHMHPVTIIFALLMGEAIGGVIGLIIAVPTLAILKVLFAHFQAYRTNIDKN